MNVDMGRLNGHIEEVDRMVQARGMLMGDCLCIFTALLIQTIEAAEKDIRHHVMVDVTRAVITGDITAVINGYAPRGNRSNQSAGEMEETA